MDEDYPKNMLEMEQRFGTEDACRHHLIQLRWPNGFVCPACQGKAGWLDRRHRWTCQDCRRQSTVTAGTIFEGIHLPLASLVSGCLAGHQSKVWCQCFGDAAGSRIGQL